MILALLDSFRTYSKEYLETRADAQDLSFSVERLPFGHYAIGEYINTHNVHHYHLMLDDIYYEMCVAMSMKTWPYMNQLNDLILQITESGIQQYVEYEVVLHNSNMKIQEAVRFSRMKENPGPIKLTPSHIVGACILLGIGVGISIFVFIIEIIYHNRKKKLLRNNWKFIIRRLNEI
jgi:preprotein translocase subunit Sec61beta